MQSVSEKVHPRVNYLRSPAGKPREPRTVRWTVDEYYAMYHQGLFEGRRVELIKGEIFEMGPMSSPHATSIRLVIKALENVFREGFDVRSQMPMSFSRIDEPEPDVAVVAGSIKDFTDAHPTTAALIVEVAFTSARFDRTHKLKLYAENRIPDYWLLDLKRRKLEINRRPTGTTVSDFGYDEKIVAGPSESVSPLGMPGAMIAVSDLLP